MNKVINKIIGDMNEKKAYKENEKRAKALPPEYAAAYKEIKNYIFSTSGVYSMEPLKTLVEIFEEAIANGRSVTDITGTNVAAFADELVSDSKSYRAKQAEKLNEKFEDANR